jgi:hypothetical protein
VEITRPQSRWKLPFAEALAISAALVIFFFLDLFLVCMFV